MRRLAILGVMVLVAASCGATEPSPSLPRPVTGGSQAPMTTASPAPIAPSAAPPSASTSMPSAYPWMSADELALGRGSPHAVLLGDGRVLVVGNDDYGCVRDDTVLAETWDPATDTWTPIASLNQPRDELIAVALADGRAMVVGGVNGGDRRQGNSQTYSSTWLYDPMDPEAGWTRTGLLHASRGAPAAVTLADGRVLVMGGFYLSGTGERTSALTVAWNPGDGGDATPVRPADVDPGPASPILATAELYSPATGEWARTSLMRYARIDPAAVRLADGRVLVVGSRERTGFGWSRVNDKAAVTAEVFDPATGRFTMTDRLPAVDWSPIADVGRLEVSDQWARTPIGTLVALADGGALLVEAPWEWTSGSGSDQGRLVRMLRFDPATLSWTVVDTRLHRQPVKSDLDPMIEAVAGHVRSDPMLALLADGRVLVAGGIDGATISESDEAELYDPANDTWTALPAMPDYRQGGATVVLADGSVMLVGGLGDVPTRADRETDCGEGRTGLAPTVRYIPGE